MRTQGIQAVWPDGSPVIGMVHLLPLPGAPAWGGSMDAVVDRARADAAALADAGFHGLIVENYADVPFFADSVPPETVAALTVVASAVVEETDLPVGVNVLRNDARSALAIAAAVGARFIRVNVHTGSMWTDQGLVEGRAAETVRAREALDADVAILADVHVKHAVPPAGSTLAGSAADAWHRGMADGLIVSGRGTGGYTEPTDVETVRLSVPGAPVLVGSGVTSATVRSFLGTSDGVIVGSAVMREGRAGAGVAPERARAFMDAARG